MKRLAKAAVLLTSLACQPTDSADHAAYFPRPEMIAPAVLSQDPRSHPDIGARAAQLSEERERLAQYRPKLKTWDAVFSTPESHRAYVDKANGRLVAAVPKDGGQPYVARELRAFVLGEEPSISFFPGEPLAPVDLSGSPAAVERALEQRLFIDVTYNTGRRDFLAPLARYGGLLDTFAQIFAAEGVPPALVAQALLESGLDPYRQSPAGAVSTFQFMPGVHAALAEDAAVPFAVHDQFMQARFAAARLFVSYLRTKGSHAAPLEPSWAIAPSEFHTGPLNVAYVLRNGTDLSGTPKALETYEHGARFMLSLFRNPRYPWRQRSDVRNTFGPESYTYNEIIAGLMPLAGRVLETIPQERVVAQRLLADASLEELVLRAGVDPERFETLNPHIRSAADSGAVVYLPGDAWPIGPDATWWRDVSEEDRALRRELLAADLRWDGSDSRRIRRFADRAEALGADALAAQLRWYDALDGDIRRRMDRYVRLASRELMLRQHREGLE